jgi:hypothetical protein
MEQAGSFRTPRCKELINFLEHSLSSESNKYSASQHFLKPKCSLPCSQESAVFPILSYMNPGHIVYPIYSSSHIYILRWLGRSKESFQVRDHFEHFVTCRFFTARSC